MFVSNICIVDDEPDLGKICADHFGAWFKVRTFLSAEAALKAVADEGYTPDLVLADIKMPGINGLEMLHHLNTSGKRCPSIVMSAYADKNYALQAIEERVSAFIEKPFSLEELEGAILKVMDQQRQIQELESITAKYEQLGRATLALTKKYTHHHVASESFIFGSDLSFSETEQKSKDFLVQIRDEKNLEKLVESLGKEIENSVAEYKKKKPI